MVGFWCTNHVQDTLGDIMRMQDVKIGMEVINTHKAGKMYNKVGVVYKILDETVLVKYPEKTPLLHSVEYSEQGLWCSYPWQLEPFIDPEEDLIVWGALEVGEHFKFNREDSKECVKIASGAYVVLGYPGTYIFIASTAYKVKLI